MDPLTALEDEIAATAVRREVEIEAEPADVWESLATDEGRERWLEDDPEREIHVETADEPSRLVWWWWTGDEPATRVELVIAPVPAGTRVVVTETMPRALPTARAVSTAGFPLATFARSLARVAAPPAGAAA